ncbi:unnamed protein product, partial [Phaeothamnion confervicola]
MFSSLSSLANKGLSKAVHVAAAVGEVVAPRDQDFESEDDDGSQNGGDGPHHNGDYETTDGHHANGDGHNIQASEVLALQEELEQMRLQRSLLREELSSVESSFLASSKQLQAMLVAREHEIVELKGKLATLGTSGTGIDAAATEADGAGAKSLKTAATAEREDAEVKAEALCKALDAKTAETKALAAELHAARAAAAEDAARLDADWRALEEQREEQRRNASDRSDECFQLRLQLEAQRTVKQEMQAALEQEREATAAWAAEATAASAAAEQARREVEALNSALQVASSQSKSVDAADTAETAVALSSLQGEQAATADTAAALFSLQREAAALRSARDDAERRLANAEALVAAHATAAQELQQRMDGAAEESSALKIQLAARSQELAAARSAAAVAERTAQAALAAVELAQRAAAARPDATAGELRKTRERIGTLEAELRAAAAIAADAPAAGCSSAGGGDD